MALCFLVLFYCTHLEQRLPQLPVRWIVVENLVARLAVQKDGRRHSAQVAIPAGGGSREECSVGVGREKGI